jgi:hypothetical protein
MRIVSPQRLRILVSPIRFIVPRTVRTSRASPQASLVTRDKSLRHGGGHGALRIPEQKCVGADRANEERRAYSPPFELPLVGSSPQGSEAQKTREGQ